MGREWRGGREEMRGEWKGREGKGRDGPLRMWIRQCVSDSESRLML